MRSTRTVLLLALVALSAAALAGPGSALADEWTKSGQPLEQAIEPGFLDEGLPLEKESGPVSLEGKVKFNNATWGGQECTLNAKATLGTNGVGQISEASISAASCKLLGPLVLCKLTSVVPSGLPWGLAAGSKYIATGATITYKYEGQYCPLAEETISGPFTATPNNSKAMSSLSLSGNVNSTAGGGVKKAVTGTLNVSPAGRYGIGQVAAVQLSGSMKWQNATLGSLQCGSVNGTLALEPGGSGSVRSFKWNGNPICTTSGSMSNCKVTSAAPKGLPWTIQNEGTRIGISSFGFTMTFEGAFCPIGPFDVAQSVNLTPNDANSISTVSMSGIVAKGGEWTGEFNWSPAGVYGL